MAAIGAIGVALGATAGTTTAMVVGMAVTGAVVGGVYAAVTGKNILKGALIGGVVGGLAGWGLGAMGVGTTATPAATAGPTVEGLDAMYTATPLQTSTVTSALPGQVMQAGIPTAPAASKGILGSLTASDKLTLASGAAQGIGGIFKASAEQDAIDEQKKQYDQALAERRANAGSSKVSLISTPDLSEPWKSTLPITTPTQQVATQPVTVVPTTNQTSTGLIPRY